MGLSRPMQASPTIKRHAVRWARWPSGTGPAAHLVPSAQCARSLAAALVLWVVHAVTYPAASLFFEPQWFVPGLSVFWLMVSAVYSHLAGWRSLVLANPDHTEPQAATARFVTGALGSTHFPIKYRNCLRQRIGPQGLGVAVMFPFNFRSAPFFVPWVDVQTAQENQLIMTKSVHTAFRGQTKAPTLSDPIGQHVLAVHRGAKTSTQS